MRIIRHPDLYAQKLPAAITMGHFDGVHGGHRVILRQLVAKARELGVLSVVILFEPQANEYFALEKKIDIPARLTRFREKINEMTQLGVDIILCLRFDKALAALSAETFLQKIIFHYFKVEYWLVGDDFHFGADRKGDYHFLEKMARAHSFILQRAHTFLLNGERVSSTLVRAALATADLKLAEHYLGRPYSLVGRVAQGHQRGRIIGFPTANIHLLRRISPVLGVFAVTIKGIGDSLLRGVANVGLRPTVEGTGTRVLLEVHIFDFNENIYGHYLEVEFIHKLRDEKKYDSFDALKEQILLDAKQARDFFKDV
jgi:riboflavin kinase/FMN adenylyltransferase